MRLPRQEYLFAMNVGVQHLHEQQKKV